MFCLFVCFFFVFFSFFFFGGGVFVFFEFIVSLENSSYGDITITGEGLYILATGSVVRRGREGACILYREFLNVFNHQR